MGEPPQKLDIGKELAKGLVVHPTLKQEIVVTTTDKLNLCLIKHQNILSSRQQWIAPLSVLLSLLITLVAADFKDFLHVSKESWKISFCIGIGVCLLWLASALSALAKNKSSKHNEGTIEGIIEELKRKTPESESLLNVSEDGKTGNSAAQS